MRQLLFSLSNGRALLLALVAGALAAAGGEAISDLHAGSAVSIDSTDLMVGAVVFVLTLAASAAVREALEERRRLRAIQEVHHHVRNALQVVRLHEQLGADPGTRAYVDEAIERIEWVMREVLPGVGALGVDTRRRNAPQAQEVSREDG